MEVYRRLLIVNRTILLQTLFVEKRPGASYIPRLLSRTHFKLVEKNNTRYKSKQFK